MVWKIGLRNGSFGHEPPAPELFVPAFAVLGTFGNAAEQPDGSSGEATARRRSDPACLQTGAAASDAM